MNEMMEERIWDLVEKALAGDAQAKALSELKDLLDDHPIVKAQVMEFLQSYQDPDPQISELEKKQLLNFLQPPGKNVDKERNWPLALNNYMIRNYLKIAWRNLLRQRVFSSINIVGLAIGLATFLLIGLYVFHELSYDRFNVKAGRIVRVVFKGNVPGGKISEAHVMPPVAQVLKADFPEVEETVRLRDAGRPLFVLGGKRFYGNRMLYADPALFRVFTLPLLEGNPETALTAPHGVVVSEQTALKYFGSLQVLGRTFSIEGGDSLLTVTGVMKDIPENSHFHADVFASMAGLPDATSTSWMDSEFYTYLLLRPGANAGAIAERLPTVFEKYAGPQFPAAFGMSYSEFRKAGNHIGLFLQKLTDIHLETNFSSDLASPGDIRYVYIFGAVAIFMLLIAMVNFMNLSTAGASRRAKEVGVRKVLGSGKRELSAQFLVESILLVYLSLFLAFGLLAIGMPLFNHFFKLSLNLHPSMFVWLFPGVILFGLLVGILSGSYPAFFLSAFKPIAVLKGRFKTDKKGLGMRSGLVVFQFFVSIVLVFGTLVIYEQLFFIQHKKLGYDKDHVLVIQSWPLDKNEEVLRQELLQDPRVLNVTNSPYMPVGPSANNNFFVHTQAAPSSWTKTLRYDIDERYIPTLGIQLKAGRNFSQDYGTDSLSAILNETAATALGWKDDALGKTLVNKDNKVYRVVGVVKDFHFKSLHESISPMVMVMQHNFGNLMVKTKKADMEGLIKSIEKRYNSLNPEISFSYQFLDDFFNYTYRAEQVTGSILGLFAGLTIFVACLGLLGLVMFTADQRKKEIGVRKVLGATVSGIVMMLSKDFVKLVCLALVIASPLAWCAMNQWLNDFAYRITIQWWMFAVAGVGAIMIALLTVGFQAIRAAVTNPVDSLRDE
ncbi:putative ABC transport system permease protein [bacterium A37T11]|nr:putative ABC transport system permease protein [bacterium A37T11]